MSLETTITGSLRKVQSGKSHLMKVCLNFKKEHVDELQLDINKYVEVTRSGDKFKVRFLHKPTARSLALSKSSNGARLMMNPAMFKIAITEPTDTNTLVAEYLDDMSGLTFDFNMEEFVKPREERTIATISSPIDKIDAGFEPDSAWGVAFQEKVDILIQERIDAYFRAKLELTRGL